MAIQPLDQPTTLDQAKSEAFAGHMLDVVSHGLLGILCSIGHRTGLFDRLADLPRSTSAEIAAAAGLTERYVREWLAAMVTGRILEYDPSNRTYWLPAEHAPFVTRAGGPDNMAFFCQYVALAGNVEPELVRAFHAGGGVPYASYQGFQELQREETAAIYDATLIDRTLPEIPGLLGRLRAGVDVADIGCGAGHAINLMARAFPNSRFVGYDFSDEGIELARREAAERPVANAQFIVQDVAQLADVERFDFITAFDTIHDQARPRDVLANIHRALRPSGTFLMVDIAASSELHENLENPLATLLYSVSTLHCTSVSLAQDGEGWGAMWGEQMALRQLAAAGFTHVEVKRIERDIMNSYYVATKS